MKKKLLENKKNIKNKNRKNKLWINPRIWISILILSLLLLYLFSPLKLLFDKTFLIEYLQANRCCVITPFIIAYTLLTIIGIPGTILTIAGGIVFGIWWGTLWSVIGATLGALGAFLTARYLLRDFIKNKFHKHKFFTRCDRAIIDRPFSFVLAIRFAPISPFNVVNFLFGLTSLNWFTYTIATFIGIIPGTLAYTWLGTTGADALSGGDRISFIIALFLLAILSIIPLFFKQKKVNQYK